MKEMMRVNGEWAPAAEVEADLVKMMGPEIATQMMEAARENAKMSDDEVKAAVARMWDELRPSSRHVPLSPATPRPSPMPASSTDGPRQTKDGSCEGIPGALRSGSESRRTKELERQPLDGWPAASSASTHSGRRRPASDVRQSASLAATSDENKPDYMTAVEVARLLQVSAKSIYRWAAQDATMPVLRIGGVVRFPRERLLRWLRNHEQGFGRAHRSPRRAEPGESGE